MKILYYTHNYFLDCDLPLIRELRALGHEVYFFFEVVPYSLKSTLFSIDNQFGKTGIFPISVYKELTPFEMYVDKGKSFVLNRTGKIFTLANLKMRLKFAKMVKEINPDVIYCTDFIDCIDRFLYRYKNKIVQMVHDPFPHIGESPRRKLINRAYAFKRLKSFVLLNQAQVPLFSERFNIPKKFISVNRLGTYDCLHMYRPQNIKQISEENKKHILFWGRISPYKGVDYLLKAMELVHKKLPSVKLVVAGAGAYYFDYSKYEHCDYINFIHRYLEMDELYTLLAQAKVVVCPYIEATQSGVVMTAFAMDIPVVVTAVGGLPEMVEYGKLGSVVPPKDFIQLSEAMLTMLTDEDYYSKKVLSIKNMKNVGKHSWAEIAKKYVSIFENVL